MRIHSMFGHRHKPKEFNYEFRHYDPEEDEREKRRIKIERPYKKKSTRQVRSVAMLAAGLAFIIWIITWL